MKRTFLKKALVNGNVEKGKENSENKMIQIFLLTMHNFSFPFYLINKLQSTSDIAPPDLAPPDLAPLRI
jgi:hypothetical protein